MHIYIYTHIYAHTCVYIYIYMHTCYGHHIRDIGFSGVNAVLYQMLIIKGLGFQLGRSLAFHGGLEVQGYGP